MKKRWVRRGLIGLLLAASVVSMVPVSSVMAADTGTGARSVQSTPEVTKEWAEAHGWEPYENIVGDWYYKIIDDVKYLLYDVRDPLKSSLGIDTQENIWYIAVIGNTNASGVVEIPGSIDGYPVLEIGIGAFSWNDNLSEVILPEGLGVIRDTAFYMCNNLSKVSFPSTLVSIESSAFASCDSLLEVTLPASLKVIWGDAFMGGWEHPAKTITFEGNAPLNYTSTFSVPTGSTVNRYSNTNGWGSDSWKDVNMNVIENGEPAVPDATSMRLSPESVTISVGESVTVEAITEPAEAIGNGVLWFTSPGVYSDGNGVFTANRDGNTTVTAYCGSASATMKITVAKEEVPPTPDPDVPDTEPTPDPDDPETPAVTLPYTDVNAGDWFYDTVTDVYQKGLMTGKNPTTFAPGETLARAQFATILYRMENEPNISFSQVFKDVGNDIWYTDPILWAADSGVVTGYSNGNFGPADMINREQMATMMFRYANAKGLDTSQRADFSSYPDAGSVSLFAEEAMSWCVANGIISGDNGYLNPQGETARAVCATIISRFYGTYNIE